MERKFEEKLKPINDRLDRLEYSMDWTNRKLDHVVLRMDGLELSVKHSEKAIRSDIAKLRDAAAPYEF